jgi:hypothetical protein
MKVMSLSDFLLFLLPLGFANHYLLPYYNNNTKPNEMGIVIHYMIVTGGSREPRAKSIWDTWGKRIQNEILFITDHDSNLTLPFLKVMNISDDIPQHLKYRQSQMKWFYGLDFACKSLHDYDWLFFLDDDTFVVDYAVRNLLAEYNSSEAILIGKVGEPTCHVLCGGAGFALSQRLVKNLIKTYRRKLLQAFVSVVNSSNSSVSAYSDVILSTFILAHRIGTIIPRVEFKNSPPKIALKWYHMNNRTPSAVVTYHYVHGSVYEDLYRHYYLDLPTKSGGVVE